MKITNRYYGYPTLGFFNDDMNGQFSFTTDAIFKNENEAVEIRISIALENDLIISLIKSKKAIFVAHFEESQTCFRETYRFDTFSKNIMIPSGRIRGNVDLCLFVLVLETFEIKDDKSFDDFYKGITITYEPFQLIAIAEPSKILIEKEEDEIKNTSSIFSIIPNKEAKVTDFKSEISEERIIIIVPKNIYNLYYQLSMQNKMSNRSREILLSVFIIPVMINLLNTLKSDYELYEEKIWFKSIVKAYEDKRIDLISEFSKEQFDSYMFAQVIFDTIFEKSISQLHNLLMG